jgi:hypothetical protein
MQIKSKIITIPNKELSTEYIEFEIQKLGLSPIRWAIVGTTEQMVNISVAYTQNPID